MPKFLKVSTKNARIPPKHDPLFQLQQKTHHFTPVFASIPGCSPWYCPNSASMPHSKGVRNMTCLAHCYWRWLTNTDIWLLYFSPNSVWTPRGSHGRCKGRCLIRVLTLVCGILPVNFHIKWLLWNLDVRFDCAGSHKVRGAVLVCGVLPVNFRKKWLLWHVDLHFDCARSHKVWS